MHAVARVRHELARRPWIHWLVVGTLAGTVAFVVHHELRRLDAARARWGDTRPVLVATAPLAPGEPLGGRITRRDLPAAVVPERSIDRVDGDSVSRQHVAVGEVLTELDVAPAGGPGALTPDGWVAVAVVEVVRGPAGVGDRVVVASGGVEVAGDAVVVDVDDLRTVVAVPRERAAVVAAASSSPDGVALLLVP